MSHHHHSFFCLCLTLFFLQISFLHSTPHGMINENLDFQYLIKNILTESNSNEQIILLNQLREYLNRMCIIGYFGSTHAHACQRIVDIAHQINSNNDDDHEQHGIQKRFFCNGFIGCKNAGR